LGLRWKSRWRLSDYFARPYTHTHILGINIYIWWLSNRCAQTVCLCIVAVVIIIRVLFS
jgi:hypothetical protein